MALLTLALSFPTVVYTVLLAVVLVYWLVVLVGAAGIDLLGGGHDALGADHGGALDGLDHGGHADVGGADGHGGDGMDGDGIDGADGGGAHTLGSALRLRSAPLTVVVSLLVTFGWLACVLIEQSAVGAWATSWPSRATILVVAAVIAVLVTSIAIRPIAKLFVARKATGNNDLVGKVCRIRTGTADASFGEATLEDGGAGLVLRVRVPDGVIERGGEAVIVAWDADREVFTVAPLEEVGERRSKS